jgi:hypothetical protein
VTAKLELKPIEKSSVPRALEKAERYRLLNEPFLAESICLDILAVEPANQQALVCYVLALSDQFQGSGLEGGVNRAKAAVAKLESEYERLYYEGLVYERRGHAHAESNAMGAKEAAWEYITDAMELYEKAHAIHPPGNDDTTLRWNTCVRLIETHRLSAPTRTRDEYPLE